MRNWVKSAVREMAAEEQAYLYGEYEEKGDPLELPGWDNEEEESED